jgi:glycosyltransferase involved in cell wall biosynthesis
MPTTPDIAVIICTFERPGHLRRCLLSLAAQRGVDGRFEAFVVDDGSRDHTPEVVERFRREVRFPVTFLTHPKDGFQQSRCRNEGILASTAPYLLFTDADCLLPPDHLAGHLAARRPGVARAGDCFRIDQAASELIDELAVQSGLYLDDLAPAVRRWRRGLHRKAVFYQLTRNRLRPKLIGWNMAMWRSDVERINGFDQRFRAWSCEDDDLAARLRASGVRIRTALSYTNGYHLWHPPHSTTPQEWKNGPNVPYLRRPVRLTRCLNGLKNYPLSDVSAHVIAGPTHARLAAQVAPLFKGTRRPLELELLFWPASTNFTRTADHRILLAADPPTVPDVVRRRAHATIQINSSPLATHVFDQIDHVLHGLAVDPRTLAA